MQCSVIARAITPVVRSLMYQTLVQVQLFKATSALALEYHKSLHLYWSGIGRSECSGNVAGLKFKIHTPTQLKECME